MSDDEKKGWSVLDSIRSPAERQRLARALADKTTTGDAPAASTPAPSNVLDFYETVMAMPPPVAKPEREWSEHDHGQMSAYYRLRADMAVKRCEQQRTAMRKDPKVIKDARLRAWARVDRSRLRAVHVGGDPEDLDNYVLIVPTTFPPGIDGEKEVADMLAEAEKNHG